MTTERLQDEFFSIYGKTSGTASVFFSPGRVNLIGEHTDYNGGYVFPCAIQFGTWLCIRPNASGVIRLASMNLPFRAEIKVNDISSRVNGEWVNYPLGVFDQFLKKGIPSGGLDMLYYGNIPPGAGLSSSASIEMVTAFALNDLLHGELEVLELVKLSQKAENEFVGVNCGIMDQFAVGMGEKGYAIFLNCLTLENKLVPVRMDGFTLVIANTNKKRELSDSKYNERVAECQLAVTYLAEFMEISKLGEVSFMQFYKIQDCIPDEVIRKRARHVISENQRVLNAVSCLLKNDLLQFGALMNASHESLRENYEVTGFELDTLVEEAQKINGVIGARMTGAGFGGCTVNVVKTEVVPSFIELVGERYMEKTGLKADFYIAGISEGVRRIH